VLDEHGKIGYGLPKRLWAGYAGASAGELSHHATPQTLKPCYPSRKAWYTFNSSDQADILFSVASVYLLTQSQVLSGLITASLDQSTALRTTTPDTALIQRTTSVLASIP
jgi:hypothetical protein